MKKVTEKLKLYQEQPETNVDPEFYEGLSALASSNSHIFLLQILPPIERKAFKEENYEISEFQLQLKLDNIAIQCLQIANRIHLGSSTQVVPVHNMSINWRRFDRLSVF